MSSSTLIVFSSKPKSNELCFNGTKRLVWEIAYNFDLYVKKKIISELTTGTFKRDDNKVT